MSESDLFRDAKVTRTPDLPARACREYLAGSLPLTFECDPENPRFIVPLLHDEFPILVLVYGDGDQTHVSAAFAHPDNFLCSFYPPANCDLPPADRAAKLESVLQSLLAIVHEGADLPLDLSFLPEGLFRVIALELSSVPEGLTRAH